ncbi:tyrosine--tRNA ligase [Senegalia massiliensis]|uniref:Tyrosine--tRNA ligase n=1 Tax=Senegalia massiliensis TaxID=1720316 RepID=A0A845R1M9_9CLOT|nr:tyrosine--tRNA ligase [Senegalia massiliensis]NBI07428.1 tyrosine--tRNA ligase [Senegalia massiliensis]
MSNIYDILVERGFIEQATHEDEIRELLDKESVTFYVGFDPTGDSLHVGHFVQVMVMMHMQKAGHKPIALVGGGTAKIGDPSGRSDIRKMLTEEQLDKNVRGLTNQLSKYLNLDRENGYAVNNKDWLDDLKYIEFIRDIGKHFSVNRMLTAECFKSRLEKGLSFLEFNYMLLQSYDFLELNKRYGCKLEMGGNDQWSNIIAGVDLVRREEQKQVYGLTFKLLTTSEGKKMGKTESGAVWVDPDKTSPFELYQYLRNIDDADVENTLAMLTFLPMEEVRRLGNLEGSEINKAKEILAFEFTKIVHGEEEAMNAQKAAKALFSGGNDMTNIPSTEMEKAKFEDGIGLLALMTELGLTASNGEARRLVKQGGVSVNDEKITDFKKEITLEDFVDNKLLIKKGKKKYHQVIVK